MKNKWTKLSWDSSFFGFNVARITQSNLTPNELSSVLRELRDNRFRLCYWSIPAGEQHLVDTAVKLGGFLADKKTTYVKDLSKVLEVVPHNDVSVIPYLAKTPDQTLIELALTSGNFSRFKLDPSFPSGLYNKLYTCWITRSVRKEIAWQVLVAKLGTTTLGMLTLGKREKRGDIGLVAVSPEARGKGIGRLLVSAANKTFFSRGYDVAQVVTQLANKSACKLYEACGYRVEKMENILHFWLCK